MVALNSCHHHDLFVYDDSYDKGQKAEVTVTDDEGTEFLKAGSTIGIYYFDEEGNISFLTVEIDNDGNAILPPTVQKYGFVAYLPYQESWDKNNVLNPGIFKVKTSQTTQKLYEESDLMIGSYGEITRANIKLNFRHMLAKVVVNVSDETGKYNLPESTLSFPDINDAVDVFLKWMSVETIPDSRQDIKALNSKAEEGKVRFQAIVPPQYIHEGKNFIKFQADERSLSFSLPEDADLQGGKTFVCDLVLTDNGLLYNGGDIKDWEDDGGDSLTSSWK